jgi:hypothetical protein
MKLAWLIAAIAAFSTVPAGAAQPVYVSVYEPEHTNSGGGAAAYNAVTRQYVYPNGTSHVRVAFTYSDGQWRALPHDDALVAKPPHGLEAFPQALGFNDLSTPPFTIDATRGDWTHYGDIGVYRLAAPMPVARLNPANGMADWSGPYRYAPVLLTTASGKRAAVTAVPFGPERLASLLPILRQQVPTYAVCDQPEHQIRNQAWQAKDVQVQKTIGTPAGTLVELALDRKLDHCGFDDAGSARGDDVVDCDYCSHWFLVGADGKVRALGNEMDLIGVGDLAGDGRVEWLFSQHAEDYDSYVLFADDFATRVDFSWTYA